MTENLVEEVFKRQSALFDPQNHQVPVTILGAGATGSFTALALAKLGFKDIRLWDADTVEVHNVPNQLHRWGDCGKSKVQATAEIIQMFCEGLDEVEPVITTHAKMFEAEDGIGSGVVVCAADKMDARKLFWDKVKGNVNIPLYLDPRVSGQIFHLYSIEPFNPAHIEVYEASLHSDEEGDEVPCGERATCDMSFLVASRVARAIRRYAVSTIVEPFNIEDARILQVIQACPTEGE